MNSRFRAITSLMVALLICHPKADFAQVKVASWLDQAKPASWNTAGLPVPAAPRQTDPVDPRCRAQARPVELEADRLLRAKGWDLIGEYQGGWQVIVLSAAAAYDGMCRPLQYQTFVFVRGVFAGTLSPKLMDSRTDGALSRVSLQNGRLSADYLRYSDSDALCCASSTTSVQFEIPNSAVIVRPVSASTSPNK